MLKFKKSSAGYTIILLELPCFTPSLTADNGPLDGFLIKAISIPNDNNSFLILKYRLFHHHNKT